MKLAFSKQMKAIDKQTIDEYKVPGVVLMENAALSVFKICKQLDAFQRKRAVVFCGAGNNGGDGFALARHMANDGLSVTLVLVSSPEKIKGDAKINYDICVNMRLKVLRFEDENINAIANAAAGTPLIIDAMLGTGVSGDLRSPLREAVEMINESGGFVVSIDCPTGGSPDNGKVSGVCVKADITVSLALIKPGLLLYPLADYAGKVVLGQIGAPKTLIDNAETGLYALDAPSAAALLPKRYARSNKGTYGRAVIVAGSRGMAGAAAFCAKAAYAAGCGYVDVCAPESAIPVIQQLAPQAVSTPLPERNGYVYPGSAEKALNKVNAGTVCLLGPGLGNTEETSAFVKRMIINADKPLIIDADGLNAIAGNQSILKEARFAPVITPHPLEMSRLCGIPVQTLLDDILKTAIDFSKEYNAITVLKDASTVISDGQETYINNGACSALAKAGSGDILAGILTGLAAQGKSGLEAGALAVYIHAECGRLAALNKGDYSVSSEELIASLHEVFMRLSGTEHA